MLGFPIASYPVGAGPSTAASSIPAPAPTVTSVTITPAAVTLAGSTSQQFTANVLGSNSPSQAVTWSKVGGGTLDSAGNFAAPAATSVSQVITITAASVLDPSKSGAAIVTVAAVVVAPPAPTVTGVAVTPASTTVAGGATQQFAAVVAGTNSPSQTGTWSAAAGAIVAGLFVAPAATSSLQTIDIVFIPDQDKTKSGHATVTVPALVVAPPGPAVVPAPTGADICLFTIMQLSTINLSAPLGPTAINLTVSLS